MTCYYVERDVEYELTQLSIVLCTASVPPVRPLQTGVRPIDSADKHPDAIARLLASGVADHRLPNVPAQLAKTVDEIECTGPPSAAI